MARVYQGIKIKGINKNAKYKMTYTISQTVRNGVAKYVYSKKVTPSKKYSYST